MAEISKITLPSGVTYDIKDATARAAIAGGTSFLGITTTALTDGATTTQITVNSKTIGAVNGGIVIYSDKEFIYSTSDNKWHEIGDTNDLGALAYKSSASTSYKPAGSVSQPTFTGNALTSTGSIEVTGTVTKPTFSGTQGNVSVSGVPAGTISVGTGTANYTPEGDVSAPTITVTPSTTTKYVASSATGGGSVTKGTAAECVLPTLTTTVQNETLTIAWAGGSFVANTPTAVTMPSFTSQTIATGISSASASTPVFTGSGAELKFTGSSLTSTGKFTPAGSVSQPTFSSEPIDVSVSGTPTGTVSQPTFSGTQATITVS